MARIQIFLFGSPRVVVEGQTVEFDTRKATALLAYLAVSGGAHQRDSLAGLLWPDADQSGARAALRRTLSVLNRAVEDDSGKSPLAITRESLAIEPEADLWLDVSAFRQAVERVKSHGHGQNEVCAACIEPLSEAARQVTDRFMAGFSLRDSPDFEEWQFFQQENLSRELAIVLEKLSGGLNALGRYDEAIESARRWLALDPLVEDAHGQLIYLYARAGQRSAALRQYRECTRILDEELGVSPLEETTSLYEIVLNRQPLPESIGRFSFAEAADSQKPAPLTELVEQKPEKKAQPPLPLVGRQYELSRMIEGYESINLDGAGVFVALAGEAGIGKTRLSDAFIAEIHGRGGRVIRARSYPGETGLAYGALIAGLTAALAQPGASDRLQSLPISALAEVSRLLPEISAPPPPADIEKGQARFFESLRLLLHALLEGNSPGVLFFDDLHWADSATLDFLSYLARRLDRTQIFLLAAWREEPSAPVEQMERLGGELSRYQRSEILRLKRLDAEDIIAWVGIVVPSKRRAGEVGRRLYRESEGLPFIAAEYLSALAKEGLLADDLDGGEGWTVPSTVRDLIRSRLAGLESTAAQLLGAAAVIGRSFDFDILRVVSGRSEDETVDGLELLLNAGLISAADGALSGEKGGRRGGELRYDFTHEKLRDLVYEETSLARRRLLHRRIAESFANHRSAAEENAGLIAYHYEQAGSSEKAAAYHVIAGEQARRLFANVEAMGHFQSALAGGYSDGASLHEAIGELHTLAGDYSAALASLQTAAALCATACRARLEHKMGGIHQRLGDWQLAESHYLASLEALDEGEDLPLQARLFADRSLNAYQSGDLAGAQSLAERALKLAQDAVDVLSMAQAYNILGVLARVSGRFDEAVSYLEESLKAAESLEDFGAQAAALNNLSLAYGAAGQHETAITQALRALELSTRRGDRHRQAALHNNLADLYHKLGREDEAMAQLKAGVMIFAEIGKESESAGQIWKLVEW